MRGIRCQPSKAFFRGEMMVSALVFFLSLPVVAAAPSESLPAIMVLNIKHEEEAGPGIATILTGLVLQDLTDLKRFRVIGEKDVNQMLNQEQRKQLAGCTDTSCLVEIAGAMGTRYTLDGTVGVVGQSNVLSLSLIDVTKAAVVSRKTAVVKGEREQLLDSVHKLIRDLMEPVLVSSTTAPISNMGTVSVRPSTGLGVVTSAPTDANRNPPMAPIASQGIPSLPSPPTVGGGSVTPRPADGPSVGTTGTEKAKRNTPMAPVVSETAPRLLTASRTGEGTDRNLPVASVAAEAEPSPPMNPYKVWGHVSFWSGIGFIGLGGVFTGKASAAASDYKAGKDPLGNRDALDQNNALAVSGYVIGGTLMTTGMVLWILSPGDNAWAKEHSVAVVPEPVPSGGTVTVCGRW